MRKSLGYAPQELVGRKFIDFVYTGHVEITLQTSADILSGRPASSFENRYIRKDGALVPMVWSAVWSEAEKTIFCVARDNSEHKQAEFQMEAAAARVTNILESITEAFIAMDKQWHFTYINDEAERLLMRPRDELLGQNLWEKFPDMVGTMFDTQYHQVVVNGTPVMFEEFYPSLNA